MASYENEQLRPRGHRFGRVGILQLSMSPSMEGLGGFGMLINAYDLENTLQKLSLQISSCLVKILQLSIMLSVLLFSVLIASITAQAEEACPPGYALDRGPIPAAQKIEWVSCQLDDILKYEGLECGSVKVPLDYTGATPGVLTIPLVRWCADGTKWNGKSIVANPGGPGESGVEFLTGAGREYLLRYGCRSINFAVLISQA